MIRFTGMIPKKIQRRVKKGKKIKLLIMVLFLNLLTLAIAVAIALKFPKTLELVMNIWGVAICFETLPCLFAPCKPQRVDVFISDTEVYYHIFDSSQEHIIDILEIEPVFDYGSFYVMKYRRNREDIICVKELLAEGTLEEFESRFEDVLIRKSTARSQV